MNTRKVAAGDNIEAQCTKCRKVLNHTIVAMVGERVARVECNTCHGVHNYIREKTPASPSPRPAAGRKASDSAKAKKEPGRAEREEWQSLCSAVGDKTAHLYDMGGRYRANDLVEHPVFGVGIVLRMAGPQKMEVFFESGRKLLRCQ